MTTHPRKCHSCGNVAEHADNESVKPQGVCVPLVFAKTIVLVGRKHRSKWWGVTCCGCGTSKRRKDGSCKHERTVLENLRPDIKRYARIETKDAE